MKITHSETVRLPVTIHMVSFDSNEDPIAELKKEGLRILSLDEHAHLTHQITEIKGIPLMALCAGSVFFSEEGAALIKDGKYPPLSILAVSKDYPRYVW